MSTKDLSWVPSGVRLVRGILYALVFTPLIFWPGFYYFLVSSKLFFVLALSQVLLVGLAWLWFAQKGWRPTRSWILVSLLVYGLVVTLASVFGVNPLVSFWGSPERDVQTIVFLHLIVVFVGMVSVFRTKADWHRLFFVSVMVAVAVTLVFFVTLFTKDTSSWYALTHGGSTLGNSSFYGAYLVSHIFLALLLAFSSATHRSRVWLLGIAVFLTLGLFSTEAQTAVLVLGGGMIFFVGLMLARHNRRPSSRIVGLLIIFGLVMVASYVLGSLFFPQSPARQAVVERSSETRFLLWEMAWEGFKDRPLLGWGPENFSSVFQAYYNPCLGSSACGREMWFDRSHNKFFDLLIETGVFGLLTYLSIFLAALWGIRQAVRGKRLTIPQASLLVALLATSLVQGLMVFDTLTSYLSWFAIVGYIHTLSEDQEERSASDVSRASPRGAFAFVVFGIATAVLFYFMTLFPAKSSLATKAVFDATTLREHLFPYETAVMLSPYGIDLRRSALAAQTATIILDLSQEHQAQFSQILTQELALAEQGLLDSIKHSPDFLRGYLDLVFVYQVWGGTFDPVKMDEADALAQVAIERFPRNPLPYWARVSLFLDKGDVEQAITLAQTALRLDPQVSNSLLRWLITVKFLEDPTAELEVARQIVEVEPRLQSLVDAYLATDVQTHTIDLLFRFYYDASLE